MTDKIKSNITTSYMMFINSFGDPYSLNKKAIEKNMGCTVREAFLRQEHHDSARSKLKKIGKHEFDKAVCLYLASFLGQDGIDYPRLYDEVTKNPQFLLRSLGSGNMNYLNLLIRVLESLEVTDKKGLLFGGAS